MTGWSGLIWWVGAIGIGILVPWILVMRRQEKQCDTHGCFPVA